MLKVYAGGVTCYLINIEKFYETFVTYQSNVHASAVVLSSSDTWWLVTTKYSLWSQFTARYGVDGIFRDRKFLVYNSCFANYVDFVEEILTKPCN